MEIDETISKVREILNNKDLETEDKHKQVLDNIAKFFMNYFKADNDEVAIFLPNSLKTTLRFVYPFYLDQSDEIPINSKKPIVSRIYRSGLSFLDNELVDKERLFQYEFIKNYNDEARIIWKMMGCAITCKEEKIGVMQISRKRSSFQPLGADFSNEDLKLLEISVNKFASFLKEVIDF